MEANIRLEMKAIHGTLHYSKKGKSFQIPVEHTGDYKNGHLVFFSDIEPKISELDKPIVLKEIQRDLQVWAKKQDNPLCW